MKERFRTLVLCYLYWLVLFLLQKPLFLLFQFAESAKCSWSEYMDVIRHGFVMDLSTAGYCTILPLVLLLLSCFLPHPNWMKRGINIWNYILIIILSLLFVSDLFLYKYWGFRIDTTPLFYLKTPKDAFASGTITEYVCSALVLAIYLYANWKGYQKVSSWFGEFTSKAYWSALPLLLLFGPLFLAIRGSVGVSTMNVGFVYFSNNTYLNHAAINPTWNFLDALFTDDDFATRYHDMEKEEAQQWVEMLNQPTEPSANPSTGETQPHTLLNQTRPNIILIIMEGIGSGVIETLGGTPGVTPNLNRYTQEGVLFNNCFASSFRTDRGLVAILSGYPAQPTSSLMKYPEKTQKTPIITQKLREVGYRTAFYYGGDDNFTNMHSFLVTAGYETIVNETDFKGAELSTKWGAYDHVLFNRVKEDLAKKDLAKGKEEPFFKTILTLNSHEPFDVPTRHFEDPYLNSVFYADSCIGDFIEHYRKTEAWDNSLILVLPDHAFRYPREMANANPYRYRIPLIWLGGAVEKQMVVSKTCSQVDLATTLLLQLGLNADDFHFSKDILSDNYPEYAFYSYIDGFGLIHKCDTALYDCGAKSISFSTNDTLIEQGKAYLQLLYDDISNK